MWLNLHMEVPNQEVGRDATQEVGVAPPQPKNESANRKWVNLLPWKWVWLLTNLEMGVSKQEVGMGPTQEVGVAPLQPKKGVPKQEVGRHSTQEVGVAPPQPKNDGP